MRVSKLLKTICGLCRQVVIRGFELIEGDRPHLVVQVRPKACRRGRCGALAPWFDQGGGERRWRHVDAALRDL